MDNEQNTKPAADAGREASECGVLLGRCFTCKHWGKNRSYGEDEYRRLKTCDCPKFEYGYHSDHDDIPNDGAAIEDDEGWGMVTGPDFGCIHWLSKSP